MDDAILRILARTTVALVATFAAMLTIGCGAPIDDVRTTMTTTDDRARELALRSAHITLRELGLDPDRVAGASRVTVCTDSMGQDTDERFGDYSSGSAIGEDTLADEQIDALAVRLDVTFLEDATDDRGTRLVSFVLPVDGADIVVRLSRTPDGSGTLTTSTPCLG